MTSASYADRELDEALWRAGSNQLVSSSRDSQSKASAANHVNRRLLQQVCESGLQAFACLHSCIYSLQTGCCPAVVQLQTLMQLVQEASRIRWQTACGLHACSPVHLLCDRLHHCACMLQPLHLPCHVLSSSQIFAFDLQHCMPAEVQPLHSSNGQNTTRTTAPAVVSYHVRHCRRMHAASVMETCTRGEAGLHLSWCGARKAVAIMYMHAASVCGQSIR